MNPLFQAYRDQPFEVSIETLAQCNAACSFCPYPTIERKGTKMPDSLIERLIDEMAGFKKLFYFSPFKVSDPLLDKRFAAIIDRVNQKVPIARVRVFTNGSALNYDNAEKLHQARNVELWVSLNEHRPEQYRDLMGLDFDRTARNLDVLHAEGFQHEVNIVRVGVDPEFRAYCKERWPKFQVKMVKRESWLGYTEPDDYDPGMSPCYRWLELSIMATGKVALCCMDAEGEYAIGDVNSDSMLDIYNRWQFRESTTRKGLTPCEGCTY